MTLKVGDRARDHAYSKEVVTVTATDAHSLWPIQARYADGGTGLWKESELTKIEDPTPKFKVGDRVRALETDPGNHITKGNTYVLTRVQSGGCPEGPLLFGDPDLIGVFASRFEKVEAVPFKLEPGDKVVNRKTGRKGTVFLGLVYDDNDGLAPSVPTKAIEEYEEHHPGTYDLIKKDAPW